MTAVAELRELLGDEADHWETWVGISGMLYARRRMTSPPVVFRAITPVAVAAQIIEYEKSKS
jgi:hypothetical protein